MRAVSMKLPRLLKDPAEFDLQKLDQDPRYIAKCEELAAIERRIAESEHRARVGKARQRGQQPTVSVLERAEALVAGGRVQNMSPGAEIDAAHEELHALHAARLHKTEELEALRGEISFEICESFRPDAENALRNALEACEQLHRALWAGAVLRGRIQGAGYQLLDGVLPVHQLPLGQQLGNPRQSGTPAGQFRDFLISKGVIDG